MSRSRPQDFELPDAHAGRNRLDGDVFAHSDADSSLPPDWMAHEMQDLQDMLDLSALGTDSDHAFNDTRPSDLANTRPSDLPLGYQLRDAAPQVPPDSFLPIIAPMMPQGREGVDGDGPQPKRVLVVDDDLAARLYLRARLMLRGHLQLLEAANGAQAMQYVLTQRFDAVLLDIDMHDQSGFEVCRAIRSQVRAMKGKQPRIYMVTARSGALDRMRAKMAGADAFLSKPPHPGELAELLAQL